MPNIQSCYKECRCPNRSDGRGIYSGSTHSKTFLTHIFAYKIMGTKTSPVTLTPITYGHTRTMPKRRKSPAVHAETFGVPPVLNILKYKVEISNHK